MDEYDQMIIDIFGFELQCYEKSIGNPKPIGWYKAIDIPNKKRDPYTDNVPVVVKCHKCGEYMDFKVMDILYECPVCHRRVKESTVLGKFSIDIPEKVEDCDYDEYW